VALCYDARQENARTHITQKNIQDNPLYAKLKKKNQENILHTINIQEWLEPKIYESVFKNY